jgi:uncharacterized protein (DUF1684 family)
MHTKSANHVDLLDWRRQVQQVYEGVRALRPSDPTEAHRRWRAARDELFATHSQSPLVPDHRRRFGGLEYFPYDPELSFAAHIEALTAERLQLGTSTGEAMAFERFGTVSLPVGTLDVYWLDAYGGGLFVPFRDSTAGDATYGGGRYLLDTVKGADLGSTADGALVFDFNFAYNPSCSYDPAWTCPLPPPGNRLDIRVEAGEKVYTGPN